MEAIQGLDAEVWVISIDKANALEAMKEDLDLAYPLLLDPDSATIKAYGILNERQGKIPHPATLVIDQQGTIRFLRIDENFRLRPPAEDLIAALQELQPAAD